MIRKRITTAAALALLTATALPGMAQDDGAMDGRSHERGGGRHGLHGDLGEPSRLARLMTHRLDLDESQTQAIENITAAAAPEFDALRERMGATRDALRDLDVDASDYGSRLQNLSAELGQVTAETALLHGRVRGEVHAVLTPEQREAAAAARGGSRDRFRMHRRHRADED